MRNHAQKKAAEIPGSERHLPADWRDGATGSDRNSRRILQRIHDVHHVCAVDSNIRRSNGNLLYGIPLRPVPGAQVSSDQRAPEKEMATGNEKECIGTAIHICTHKNNQFYYDRFKEKNQIRKKEARRVDSLGHQV